MNVTLAAAAPARGLPSKAQLQADQNADSFAPGPLSRNGRPPYRVVVHGLAYFCRKLPVNFQHEHWQILDRSGHSTVELLGTMRELTRCDLVYTWGGRITIGKFLWAARLLRQKKVVMLWSGSDVLFAQSQLAAGYREPWIASKVHWGVSPWVVEEVRAMGLECEHVQTYIIPPVENPKPLPRQFSVLIYVADSRKADLYGWDRMVEVARQLPNIEFHLAGLPAGQSLDGPRNIKTNTWMPDLAPLLEQTSVYYRPVRHDGLSFTVLEALAMGRHVLYNYPLTGCVHTPDVPSACRELEKLRASHESGTLTLNHAGRRYISDFYSPQVVRANLFRRWEKIILS